MEIKDKSQNVVIFLLKLPSSRNPLKYMYQHSLSFLSWKFKAWMTSNPLCKPVIGH